MEGRESSARAGVTLAMLGGCGFGILASDGNQPFSGSWVGFVASMALAILGVYMVAKAVRP